MSLKKPPIADCECKSCCELEEWHIKLQCFGFAEKKVEHDSIFGRNNITQPNIDSI